MTGCPDTSMAWKRSPVRSRPGPPSSITYDSPYLYKASALSRASWDRPRHALGACGKNFCFASIRRLYRFNIRQLACRAIAMIVESEGTALRQLRDGAMPEARGSSDESLLTAILTPSRPTEHGQPTEHSGASRAFRFKDVISRQRAIVNRLSGNGSHTIVSAQRNKGESNEIQEAICCRPGVARRARPVPAGNGTEHHSIQFLADDTQTPGRSDAKHHHDFTGSGIGAAGTGHSEYSYDRYAGRPGGEANRQDDDHNDAS